MIQVNNPNKFSEDSLIGYFTGKDFKDALQKAQDWASSSGATIVSYYEQMAFGKSILISYKRGEWQEIPKRDILSIGHFTQYGYINEANSG